MLWVAAALLATLHVVLVPAAGLFNPVDPPKGSNTACEEGANLIARHLCGWERRPFWEEGRTCIQHVQEKGGDQCAFVSQEFCSMFSNTLANIMRSKETACLRKSWNSCAVVGSASHLKSTRFGKEIDSHDVVIRVNAAPDGRNDENLAECVGTRTDVRFLNAIAVESGLGNLPTAACTFYHEPSFRCGGQPRSACTLEPDKCLECQPSELSCGGASGQILDHLHSGVARRLLQHTGLWHTPRPSAGFIALAYALRRCGRVSMYGFGPSCDGKVGKRFYENGVDIHKKHSYLQELEFMRNISAGGSPAEAVPPSTRPWVRAESATLHMPDCLANWTMPKDLTQASIVAKMRQKSRKRIERRQAREAKREQELEQELEEGDRQETPGS